MLECVINISEGKDLDLIGMMGRAVSRSLLDIHHDRQHHRSVFTLGGAGVVDDALLLTGLAVDHLTLRGHTGVHPRIGVIDVVPFVPLGAAGLHLPYDLTEALDARRRYAEVASARFDLPCFFYGTGRSLPELRRHAFIDLLPDSGPHQPHPSAGAVCVGARGALVAYNVTAKGLNRASAVEIARNIREPRLRSLAFDLGEVMQISCNLIEPSTLGIEEVFDSISSAAAKLGGHQLQGELVGLIASELLEEIPEVRWRELGLSAQLTIESRLGQGGGCLITNQVTR
jgi:glutamate formiminotransferase